MASTAQLLPDDDDGSEVEFSINKNYAEKYETWRRKEELQKFKDRYGKDALDNSDEESSSSSSEDDENEMDASEVFDKEFYHTLSCLKSKDPKIYDKSTTFFENVDAPANSSKKNSALKSKPMFLRDYERKFILEGGVVSDEDENSEGSDKAKSHSPSYYEEQDAIKESFKEIIAESEGEEEDGIGGLFSVKVKSHEEKAKEEDEYAAWLLGNKGQLDDQEEEQRLSHLRTYWTNPTLDPGEKFLRDYILKKKFKGEKNKSGWRVEEKEEVSCDDEEEVGGGLVEQEEEDIEKMEEFEHKFNFRFEEPDQEFIKRYPRTLENSLRNKDDRRKQKRDELRVRKETEKEKHKEMLSKAKELKKKEIEARLKQLCSITGNEDIGFKGNDLEEDFDPDKHDQRMSQLFADDTFYSAPEIEKPVFPSIDEDLDLEEWDTWGMNDDTSTKKYSASGALDDILHSEDANFNMDCEFDPKASFQQEMLMASQKRPKGGRGKGRRWRARESRLAKGLLAEKPTFDPMAILSKAKLCKGDTGAAFEKYVDEYYGLEYEDIIGGDLPCRFKYRKVMPNDFGLSVEEILSADDKELNRWCSLKKALQIRPEENEKYDLQAYQKKGSNFNLKRKVFHSIFSNPVESSPEVNGLKNSKNKLKEAEKNVKSLSENMDGEVEGVEMDSSRCMEAQVVKEEHSVESEVKKRKRKRNRGLKDKAVITKQESGVGSGKKEERLRQVGGGSWEVGSKRDREEGSGKRQEKQPSKQKNNEKGVKREKFKKKHNGEGYLSGLTKSRLKAYGINPKRFENKLKYKHSD